MRAVNLIPSDERRGAGGVAGRSGGGAYAVLAGLALIVVMAAVYVTTNKSVNDKRGEVAKVTQQAEAVEAQASQLADYTKFASIRQKRVETVTELANGRFDWAHALREVARVTPKNAWLTQMTGTVSPSVSVGGAGSTLRGALPVPAITVTGCTTSQASVAKVLAAMRLIDGVQRVSLESSERNQPQAGAGGNDATASSGSANGDCRNGSTHFPKFSLVVFFGQQAGLTANATTATSASSTTPASSATPASSTTPSTTSTSSAMPATSGDTTP